MWGITRKKNGSKCGLDIGEEKIRMSMPKKFHIFRLDVGWRKEESIHSAYICRVSGAELGSKNPLALGVSHTADRRTHRAPVGHPNQVERWTLNVELHRGSQSVTKSQRSQRHRNEEGGYAHSLTVHSSPTAHSREQSREQREYSSLEDTGYSSSQGLVLVQKEFSGWGDRLQDGELKIQEEIHIKVPKSRSTQLIDFSGVQISLVQHERNSGAY